MNLVQAFQAWSFLPALSFPPVSLCPFLFIPTCILPAFSLLPPLPWSKVFVRSLYTRITWALHYTNVFKGCGGCWTRDYVPDNWSIIHCKLVLLYYLYKTWLRGVAWLWELLDGGQILTNSRALALGCALLGASRWAGPVSFLCWALWDSSLTSLGWLMTWAASVGFMDTMGRPCDMFLAIQGKYPCNVSVGTCNCLHLVQT